MTPRIRKAVIPAAGLGTRFLPATKAQPKEMLPIVDKPAIQYIVEEAVQSGIESILIVTGRNKKSIEDHFDKSVELEQLLAEKGKEQLLREVQAIGDMANVHFIRQKEPLGLGHAILCAKQFVGDEPFAVLLGDDILMSEPPALSRLIDLYRRTNRQVVGVREVPDEEVGKYGIVEPAAARTFGAHAVEGLVEKPAFREAPSNLAVMGRYVLKPDIFPVLETLERGAGGEYQLTDALHAMCADEELLALPLAGKRYDIGDKIGYMKAIIEVGLQREELRDALLPYLRELAGERRAVTG
ncbi:UTP--glucose-1-phosphate uridylyltransferase GalU [Paenibacillus sp. MWE-103]|uniref:UTP--glucose-1-phosphate uridylyltransferase n=1 Tax=Paenibacillus artemisiicola TaxID=1172618 RepID=A0ABS3WH47_9BACL|nr:UTP--glucose-1-phosphate uridylyltransferase GalU [Paenibacillus artemisiicola]MBO7747623.1 UTP--glucose-1-phosphate uridylyltransferase GalU [Paenibacillus artemisiicola]